MSKDNFSAYIVEFRTNGIEGLEKICTEIQKFKSLDEIKNIQYKGCFLNDIELPMLGLEYEIVAKDLFPSVRQSLLAKKLITHNNVISTSIYNKNAEDETHNILLGYYGAKFQLNIDFKKK